MDPIATIKPKKDTSLALLRAAKARGYQLYYLEVHDLYLDNGKPWARVRQLDVFDSETDYFYLGNICRLDLDTVDLILMRKDPPVDRAYIYATWVLSHCHQAEVMNNPQALRDCNEKVFATCFPDLCPPNLITNHLEDLKAFCHKYQDVVVKPLDGMGGKGVFRLTRNALNINATLEMLTHDGTLPVMIETFIPEIIDGDKRILLFNGEPVSYALARLPSGHDKVRGNLAAGGISKVVTLTERDRFICNQLADA